MIEQAHCLGQPQDAAQHHDIAMRAKRIFEVEKVRGYKGETFVVKTAEGEAGGCRIYR